MVKDKNKIYLDQKGYEQFLNEIEELKNLLQQNGKDKSSAYSGAVGDGWHDNFDFEQAKREEIRIGKLLEEKLEALSRIEIVNTSNEESELIDLEDYVLVEMTYGDDLPEEMIFKLVGLSTPNFIKADIPEVSLNSPIGKAVYHKKCGSQVSYTVDGLVTKILINKKAKDLERLTSESAEKKI